MQRRDLSKLLLASATGSALSTARAPADPRSDAAPYYPAVSGESSASLHHEFAPGDLRRYGADVSGATASDAALSVALSVARNGGPATLRHPGGTILLTQPVMVPNGVTLAGNSRSASIFAYSGRGSAFRNSNGPNSSGSARVAFRDLQITAKAPVAGGAAIELNAGGYAFYEIEMCQITGPFQYGIILDGTEVAHVHHNIIENYGAHSINIWIVSGAERTHGQSPGFSNSISISDNQINGGGVGIADDGGSNHWIASNNINGNAVAISIAGTIAFLIQGNEMENRDIYSGDANIRVTDSGISGESPKGPCQGGEIVANTFGANMASGNSASLKFTGASMHSAICVHGNWFRYNSGQLADIDVGKLGNSRVGPNHATARSGQHYTGVHNDADGNLLLPPQQGYPGRFAQQATLYGDARFPNQFAAAVVAPYLQVGTTSGPRILAGQSPPLGRVVGNVGDLYLCLQGGAGNTLYVKESGSNSATGWVGK
jgi:Pectate lyase superfamily protein